MILLTLLSRLLLQRSERTTREKNIVFILINLIIAPANAAIVTTIGSSSRKIKRLFLLIMV